jgi:dTDP-4-amino-4,6-dideoxygalactose transaminase
MVGGRRREHFCVGSCAGSTNRLSRGRIVRERVAGCWHSSEGGDTAVGCCVRFEQPDVFSGGADAVSEDKLAVLGGEPAFSEALHVGCPNIGDRAKLMKRIDGILDRRWLTNDGPLVREFENRVADYLGISHCVAMCNATIALEILIRAAELNGEVIVPSYTFVATAHALQWQEITPVFCDIDADSHCIDPARIERLITPRTSGIIGVHLWGRACDVEALQQVADHHGLKLVFDAAHAFGCTHQGRMIGAFGLAEVFSFHATKFINCGEGGIVATDDDELAARMRLMRNFGFAGYDRVVYLGANGKMAEMAAAMGLSSLEHLDEFVTTNRENHLAYSTTLRDVPGLRCLGSDEGERSNHQYVVVEVDERQAGLTRDQIVEALHAENVLARRYFHPGCHLMEPYRSLYPRSHLLLPVTEDVARRVFQLPTGTSVDVGTVGRIGALLDRIVSRADEVRDGLKHRSVPST